MKQFFYCALMTAIASGPIMAEGIRLKHLSSFGPEIEESHEISAFDSSNNLLFISNGSNASIDVYSLEDPINPSLLSSFTPNQQLASTALGGVNSVAVYNGILACAVEAENKQDNGYVVFYDTSDTTVALGLAEVAALPDMLTFSSDGEKLIVACEGEPSADYLIDPEGAVAIFDFQQSVTTEVIAQLSESNVVIADFNAFDSQKVALQNKGVRIFGNNGSSTVSQDMEPEYVTLSEDNSTAYISCQENNAIAVLDLSLNEIIDILALGYKDNLSGTAHLNEYYINELTDLPVLGQNPLTNEDILLGGFSGLWYEASESTETEKVFYAIPDRGPNAAPVKSALIVESGLTTEATASQNLRPFYTDWQAQIAKITLNTDTNEVDLEQIFLRYNDDTTPLTGRGNIPGYDEIPVEIVSNIENADYELNGSYYEELNYDALAGDMEGILIADDYFWTCDENRPAIYKFDLSGKLIERFVPEGTSLLGTNPQAEGAYGSETLPEVYNKRRANRGFEAIAYDEEKELIYAFIQSPMYNPDSSTKSDTYAIRILGIKTDGTPVEEYVYLLEHNGNYGSRTDKIGDAVWSGKEGVFYVIERDSSGPDDGSLGRKYIFEIDLTGATNILDTELANLMDPQEDEKTIEQMSADELMAEGIQAVWKRKVLNLPSIGYMPSDKAEGLALLEDGSLAVLNDNDFGTTSAGISDTISLGIIDFDTDHALDVSNKDDAINIQNWPTLGMYQPDAIASFVAEDGMQYIVTANEGDSRDYDAYSEEERVADIDLDPIKFPEALSLQEDANLGRLKITTANGDLDNDGDFDKIFNYGARSFSIFDSLGNLVFDSANEFETLVAVEAPAIFNQDEGEFDDRSDDKGVEPEGVVIGKIGDKNYAFIGLERQSGIMVYDLSNPFDPKFIEYYQSETDLAPEGMTFVNAENSPSGHALLLVTNELSGTTAVYEVSADPINQLLLTKRHDQHWYHNQKLGSIYKLDLGNDESFIWLTNRQSWFYFNANTDEDNIWLYDYSESDWMYLHMDWVPWMWYSQSGWKYID